jgi:hypothetical protein
MYKIQININGHWSTFITTNKTAYAFTAFKRYARSNQPALSGHAFRLVINGGAA